MKRQIRMTALATFLAVMLVGLTGAVVDLSTGPKEMVVIGGNVADPMGCVECDPVAALYEFNKNVSLDGWGKNNNAATAYGENYSMESATMLNEYYTTGPGYSMYSMESATMLDHTWDQIATQPYDGRGKFSPTITAGSEGGVKHKMS